MAENRKKDMYMPMTSVGSGNLQIVAENVHCYTNQIVNLCFVGAPEKSSDWVLVDTGMPTSAEKIISEAEELFGEKTKPKAIILTHGHFDHVGAVEELVEKWKVPVYAHTSEIPYLTGQRRYQDPDPTVAGGLVAKLSGFFPNEPVDLSGSIQKLPADGTVPQMSGWKWIHTPGHTSGHISLFRESDRTLIAGDAFTTVKQDEMFDVMTQEREINGPPRYYTPDWEAAEVSVQKLVTLRPEQAITGHGVPMAGEELAKGLEELANNFKELAVPEHGKYVE
ncbi:MBL fold metallo-hydrolase [Virgibacillus ainsalahensis]